MRTGQIKAITSHLPAAVLTSDALAELYPGWTAEKIVEKTGVRERRRKAACAQPMRLTAFVDVDDAGADHPERQRERSCRR